MLKRVRVPEIPEAEQTPLVGGLVGIIEEQAEQLRKPRGVDWAIEGRDCGA